MPQYALPKPKNAAGVRDFNNRMTRPVYDGAELRNLTPRAGAYDAFEKPSIINGEPTRRPWAGQPA